MVQTIRRSEVTARKPHTCSYCHGIINKGEKYGSSTNVYDGDMYTWKSHGKCSDIASKLKMFDNEDEGLTDEAFMEYIHMEYGQLQIKANRFYYESKGFKYPAFSEQLDFVCNYHIK